MERGLLELINILFNLWFWLLIARMLLSWVPLDLENPAVRAALQILYVATEPVLRPIREALPPTAMLDFSPFVAMLLVQILQIFLAQVVIAAF